MKQKPKGFIAQCQCGNIVGAMDYERTDRSEAGKLLGAWIHDGCIIYPKFDLNWSVQVKPCKCDK